MTKTIKILGISTSMSKKSRSRKFLNDLNLDKHKTIDYKQLDLIDKDYSSLSCSACESCADNEVCINKMNNIVLRAFHEADIIIIAAPIYYGSLTGKTKSLMECLYPFRDQQLKGKEVIVVVSSAKEGQEGIAVMELLPWCYKHRMLLVQIESIHDNTSQEELGGIVDRINQSILDYDIKKEIDIDFQNLNYLGKRVGIPIYYDVEKKKE
ncbi:hypothetical protein EZV73_11965 [Acidaminobacter sp. JC074]|uniref:NAD(P)H-dependent oxidoreductase n=1 Tax=Acidaminobacter sp. JC074 TaxID=2530199 RepID=UPI001F0FDDB6|nr:NAD(P)H-dependent oxidoreductase [Acidaminobacter sp. JC074]MCH4888296.1 hypothetical protein [Acidaminobacter sp. JC074]